MMQCMGNKEVNVYIVHGVDKPILIYEPLPSSYGHDVRDQDNPKRAQNHHLEKLPTTVSKRKAESEKSPTTATSFTFAPTPTSENPHPKSPSIPKSISHCPTVVSKPTSQSGKE